MLEVGFEPTHPKIIELKSTALDRSAIQAFCNNTTAVGFEPTQVKPTRFRIWRLNHSAMLSKFIGSERRTAQIFCNGEIFPRPKSGSSKFEYGQFLLAVKNTRNENILRG